MSKPVDDKLKAKWDNRPVFPKRAVVTGGMPYGNKALHLGHVGGVFIHADTYARFLRDHIGYDNVVFVSGTDCYGSPITESYRKATESGEFAGSIEDYVKSNHDIQKKALDALDIDINLFSASGFGAAKENHRAMSDWVLTTLKENGHLEKMTTSQFYDTERGVFLNGRQVVGRCPIEGCKSESAYADECELGHQYSPSELIAPKSTLTGQRPEMRDVSNWYFKLDGYRELLLKWADDFDARPTTRAFAASAAREFLEPPVIYLKKTYLEDFESFKNTLSAFTLRDDGEKKTSVALVFETLKDREAACAVLSSHGMNFRTGKTLVPFRLTGNTEWGVPAPNMDGLDGLTIWVWPESLWAPISFSQTYLESKGFEKEAWKNWWCRKEAQVYQFIGQDNIYFYGPAEMGMFMGLQGVDSAADPKEGDLQLPNLVVNHHVLFLDKKASSSAVVKPPMALELLDFYTAEQLRAHFLGLGLGLHNVSFSPKAFNPLANPRDPDPVLKEGALLTNVLNRIARSCFYTAQKYTDGTIPNLSVSEEAETLALEAALDFETAMAKAEFHVAMNILDMYVREANKYWSREMKLADAEDNTEKRLQVLSDSFFLLKTAMLMVHPIAPKSTEKLADFMHAAKTVFDWANLTASVYEVLDSAFCGKLEFLPPRTDFYEKHPSQLEGD